jgi:hypothetical protein
VHTCRLETSFEGIQKGNMMRRQKLVPNFEHLLRKSKADCEQVLASWADPSFRAVRDAPLLNVQAFVEFADEEIARKSLELNREQMGRVCGALIIPFV